jgi:hypothetical protein
MRKQIKFNYPEAPKLPENLMIKQKQAIKARIDDFTRQNHDSL